MAAADNKATEMCSSSILDTICARTVTGDGTGENLLEAMLNKDSPLFPPDIELALKKELAKSKSSNATSLSDLTAILRSKTEAHASSEQQLIVERSKVADPEGVSADAALNELENATAEFAKEASAFDRFYEEKGAKAVKDLNEVSRPSAATANGLGDAFERLKERLDVVKKQVESLDSTVAHDRALRHIIEDALRRPNRDSRAAPMKSPPAAFSIAAADDDLDALRNKLTGAAEVLAMSGG